MHTTTHLETDNLSRFLVNLAQDPALLEEMKANPQEFLSKAGLTPEEHDIVLSRDPQRINAKLEPYRAKTWLIVTILLAKTPNA